mgnify:CR=1 FL=1
MDQRVASEDTTKDSKAKSQRTVENEQDTLPTESSTPDGGYLNVSIRLKIVTINKNKVEMNIVNASGQTQ